MWIKKRLCWIFSYSNAICAMLQGMKLKIGQEWKAYRAIPFQIVTSSKLIWSHDNKYLTMLQFAVNKDKWWGKKRNKFMTFTSCTAPKLVICNIISTITLWSHNESYIFISDMVRIYSLILIAQEWDSGQIMHLLKRQIRTKNGQ